MVFELDLTTNIFHGFAEYLYGNNMIEQQNWEPAKYYLSSLNFGGLEDASSFSVILRKAISRVVLIESLPRICFSMILHLESRDGTSLSLPHMIVTIASG